MSISPQTTKRTWELPILNKFPSFITPEETLALESSTAPECARIFDTLIRQHGMHPFLVIGFAFCVCFMGCPAATINLCRQVAESLHAETGLRDSKLDAFIEKEGSKLDVKAFEILEVSRTLMYRQTWKCTKEHKFPWTYPKAPEDHDLIKAKWSDMFLDNPIAMRKYLDVVATETNLVEGVFMLEPDTTEDVIRKGIQPEGVINPHSSSKIQEPSTIQSIIKDTLSAYDLLSPVLENLRVDPKREKFNAEFIKSVHARLMATCQFSQEYIPPGRTRTETKATMSITSVYNIQCCPYPDVDAELEYICKMAKQYAANVRNPFASASWIHLVLTRCHPFNDGNGRTIRLIASIPLLLHGYPPISSTLVQRADYYEAINEAHDGDHGRLIRCIFEGMRDTMARVQAVSSQASGQL